MAVKILKWLSIVTIFVFVSIAIGTLMPRSIGSLEAGDTANTSRRVLILSNPIHTDIALPVDDELLSRFAFLRDGNLEIDYPGVRYLVFGWGGREFYTQTPTWADLKPLPLFKGLTLDRSVMHVALAGDIQLSNASVTALDLSDEGYGKLVDFILGSFANTQGSRRRCWVNLMAPTMLSSKPSVISTRSRAATHGQRLHCAVRV